MKIDELIKVPRALGKPDVDTIKFLIAEVERLQAELIDEHECFNILSAQYEHSCASGIEDRKRITELEQQLATVTVERNGLKEKLYFERKCWRNGWCGKNYKFK